MTENFDILESVHSLVAEIEELTAISATISGGIVTDSQVIRDYAERSGALLATMLNGHKLMLEETLEETLDTLSAVFGTVYDKS